MFRLRLHPTPTGLLFGIATIAFWALLWLAIFAQLQGAFRPTPQSELVAAVQPADRILAIEFDFR